MNYKITPPEKLSGLSVSVSASKSMENRAAIIKAIAGHDISQDQDPKDCDDVRVMKQALQRTAGHIDLENCGTAMRFLTAYYASTPDAYVILDGNDQMRKRPIWPLVKKLKQLGADIDYCGETGYPPIRIAGKKLSGGILSFRDSLSSQYISALMMIAPKLTSNLKIQFQNAQKSRPYVELTADMMKKAGADVIIRPDKVFVTNKPYNKLDFEIESDWTSVSYWYSLASISNYEIEVDSIPYISFQGDRKVSEIYELLGVSSLWDNGKLTIKPGGPHSVKALMLDLKDNPDIAQTLMVTCACIGVPFTFVGLSSLHIKETDRLVAMQNELLKLGVDLAIGSDWASWIGNHVERHKGPIKTYCDHRMAMAFAPASFMNPGLEIENVEVVSKSYPRFWEELKSQGFRLE